MEKYHYFQNSKKICQNCDNLKSFHICSVSTAKRQGTPYAMTYEMSTMLRKLDFLPFTGKIIFNLKDAGPSLERVHLHPSIYSNGCEAPVLKKKSMKSIKNFNKLL